MTLDEKQTALYYGSKLQGGLCFQKWINKRKPKNLSQNASLFLFLFLSMGYQMGEVVATKLLVVAEHGSQYYHCGNVCPLPILERYFCSVRWWFRQWKRETISKSSFQESWGSIQTFYTPLEKFLFFCQALDLTNTFFSEWESKLFVDTVICFLPDKPLLFFSSVLCRKFFEVYKMCLWMSEITFWFG